MLCQDRTRRRPSRSSRRRSAIVSVPDRKDSREPSGHCTCRPPIAGRCVRHPQTMSRLDRRSPLAVFLLASAILLASLQWGTKIAGGADPYGYLTEAGLFAQGHAIVHQAVIRQSPWPGPDGTWTPIGYRELPRLHDAMAPVYAPGLPLLMALLQAVFGYCAAFWVVPIC